MLYFIFSVSNVICRGNLDPMVY